MQSFSPKSAMLAMLLPFLLLLFFSTTSSDLTSDRAALLALRFTVRGRTLLWNASNPTPCNWVGVHCKNNGVIALHLPGASLVGSIPTGTLSNITLLQTISLRFNGLSGPLPSDLSQCTQLRNVYIQGNQFSGPLPSFLFGLHGLVRLDFSGNQFSGEISSGFNNLTRLRTLYLENNQFSGSLPDLQLPNLEQFNISFNSLNGSVPKSLEAMPQSAFSGNALCGKPLDDCPKIATTPALAVDNGDGIFVSNKKHKLSGGAIAGIVVASVVGFLFILCATYVLCRNRGKTSRSIDIAAIKQPETEVSKDKSAQMETGSFNNGYSVASAAAAPMTATVNQESGGGNTAKKLIFFGNTSRVFDLEDLLRASAEVLGKGTFGTAYKAVLEFGSVVAVKRLRDVVASEKEFREKIEEVGAMQHENLVPLRAYFYSREEKLLVYDYMPMGSLSALLHGNKGAGRTPLNWELRSNIAFGAARGLEYLHSQGPNVSHGNIKSSNILLTKSYDARVSDFGLAQLVGPPSSPIRVAGYRAPEVTDPTKVSQKADVYSFGILVLELLTGKAPTHALLNEEGVDLPRWVKSIVREEWSSEVFDLELLRYQNVEEDMVQLLQLGVDCAAQYPDNRPSMKDVSKRITELCHSSLKDQEEQPDQVHEAE